MVTFKSFLVAFSWFGMTQVTRKRVPTTWVPFYVKLDPQWRIQRRLSNKAKHRYNLGCLTTSSILLVLSFPTEAWTHFISNFFPCAWFQSQRPSSEWARRWSCSTDTRRGHHLSPPVAPPPLPEAPPPPPPVTLACALTSERFYLPLCHFTRRFVSKEMGKRNHRHSFFVWRTTYCMLTFLGMDGTTVGAISRHSPMAVLCLPTVASVVDEWHLHVCDIITYAVECKTTFL